MALRFKFPKPISANPACRALPENKDYATGNPVKSVKKPFGYGHADELGRVAGIKLFK